MDEAKDRINKNITNTIIRIKKECETYLWYVDHLSHDYGSVMKMRDIIDKSKKLEKYYNEVMETYYRTDGDTNA